MIATSYQKMRRFRFLYKKRNTPLTWYGISLSFQNKKHALNQFSNPSYNLHYLVYFPSTCSLELSPLVVNKSLLNVFSQRGLVSAELLERSKRFQQRLLTFVHSAHQLFLSTLVPTIKIDPAKLTRFIAANNKVFLLTFYN